MGVYEIRKDVKSEKMQNQKRCRNRGGSCAGSKIL